MKTQIVYVVVSSEKDVFLEELWVSVYSLRQYHVKAKINVIADRLTADRIKSIPELYSLITNLVVGDTPNNFTPKEKSRELKTTIRELIKGDFLYIDTDTVICGALEEIDKCEYDVAGVPDSNAWCKYHAFSTGMKNSVYNIFGSDMSSFEYLINGGVIYSKDTPIAHELFQRWNKNWRYSCFEKGNSQDQPALWQSDYEMGGVVKCLPDIYNSQVAMSLQFFTGAAIVHFLHMDFIPDQSYSPFLSLKIYQDLKKSKTITPEIAEQIIHCKSAFQPMTMPVGRDQLLFLFNPAGKSFVQIYKEGGTASWLMQKMAIWLEWLHKYTKKK